MVQLTETTKILAIKYYNQNKTITQKDVAHIFKINIRTFQRWLYKYNTTGKIIRKQRIAISYKIKKKHVNFSLKTIKKYPHISINMLYELLKKKFNDFTATSQHLGEVIRDNNITRKRTTRRHYPIMRYGKKINLKKELKEFYSVVQKYSLHKIICLDEISIHAIMKPNYSRCELGKRCVIKTTDNAVFIKYTVVVAISSKGVIGWKIYKKGGMTGDRMVEFINEFIKNKYKNYLIIMDNAGSHRNNSVKEVILKTKNLLRYSVPYRPKTNAIETWFSQFKHYFIHGQKNKLTYNALKKVIKSSINKINKKSYYNILEYAYKDKNPDKHISNISTRRRLLKEYKI